MAEKANKPRPRPGQHRPRVKASAADSKRRDEGGITDGIGGFVDDLASSMPLGDTLAKLIGTTERVTKAQHAAYTALGLPSIQDVERLTLRVRTLFHRIDELEDELDELDRRLARIEGGMASKPAPARRRPAAKPAASKSAGVKRGAAKKPRKSA